MFRRDCPETSLRKRHPEEKLPINVSIFHTGLLDTRGWNFRFGPPGLSRVPYTWRTAPREGTRSTIENRFYPVGRVPHAAPHVSLNRNPKRIELGLIPS